MGIRCRRYSRISSQEDNESGSEKVRRVENEGKTEAVHDNMEL